MKTPTRSIRAVRGRGFQHPGNGHRAVRRRVRIHWLLLLFTPALLFGGAESWIPARWTGGPLELELRAKSGTLPPDDIVRESIATWYDPATLDLVQGSPINCLLVTWSAGAGDAIESRQHQLVQTYAAEAHRRGLAVLGLIHPGANPSRFLAGAAEARLDGFVLEGEFPPGFAERLQGAMAIPIVKEPARLRTGTSPVLAVEGVLPSVRNLADMGIRAAPSSEPWLESNIWLVRSLRLAETWRPVWVSHQPDGGPAADYARFVADAAVAGGRWIVAPDDQLRARLRRREPEARAVWTRIGACLRFAEDHAEWRGFGPYGNLGVVVDPSGGSEWTDEYLKLLARRQIPYRLIPRTQLGKEPADGLRALLATELASPTAPERKVLSAFAEKGGLLVAGPAWGAVAQGETSSERPLGKGRVIVYKDPEPESIAREMRDLLSLEEAGMIAFNVPAVLTYASRGAPHGRVLVQLLNYSRFPATDITIRVRGKFKSAHLIGPDAEPEVVIRAGDTQTEVTIPKLTLWGGLVLEGEIP
jgi:hypothetical protein